MNNDFLFYYPKIDSSRWTYEPQGRFSVDRFIADEPCWQQEMRVKEERKKTLLLCDSTLARYTKSQLRKSIEVLVDLLKNGFKIYAASDTDLVEVTCENIEELFSNRAFLSTRGIGDKEKLIRQLAKKQVSRDEILYLDYFTSRKLFFDEKEPCIESEHIVDKNAEDRIITEIKEKAFKKIVLAHNRITPNLETFNFIPRELVSREEIQIRRVYKVKSEDIDCLLQYKSLEHLEDIAFDCRSISNERIFEILAKAPHLHEVSIQQADWGELKPDIVAALNLPKVKKISFSNSEVSGEFFSALLAKLPSIEELDLHLSTINLSELQNTLLDIPHLHTISLSRGNYVEEQDWSKSDLLKLDLKNVKKISFFRQVMSDEFLGTLLSKLPSIEIFSFENCEIDPCKSGNTHFDIPALPSLKEVSLKQSDVTSDSLTLLLAKAPSIETIDMQYARLHGLGSSVSQLDCSRLKNFSISDVDLDDKILCNFLAKTSQLENLTISGFRSLVKFGEDFINGVDFSKLKNLELTDCTISAEILGKCLAKAPNLRKLKIYDNKPYIDIPISHEQLNKIRLDKLSTLLLHTKPLLMLQILTKAPNVIKLDLCTHDISETEPVKQELLDKLPALCVKKLLLLGDMDAETFVQLLSHMPRIKKLDVSLKKFPRLAKADCELTKKMRLDNLKKLILHESDVDTDTLALFLTKVPNVKSLKLDLMFLKDKQNPETDEKINEIELAKLTEFYYIEEHAYFINKILPKIPPNCKVHCDEIELKSSSNSNGNQGPMPVDGRTGPSNNTFNITESFIGKNQEKPHVARYREKLFDFLVYTNNPNKPFELAPITRELQICSTVKLASIVALKIMWDTFENSEDIHYYYGTIELPKSASYIPLPSLNPHEEVTHIVGDVDIMFCKNNNQYFVKSRSPDQTSHIYFIVKVPIITKLLDSKIEDLVNNCSVGWSIKEITGSDAFQNGHDFLDAIIEQKKGSCRHRAVAFFHLMQNTLPQFPVRIVFNSCHAFCEVLQKDKWIACDFGGAPAELLVKPNRAFAALQQSTKSLGLLEAIDTLWEKIQGKDKPFTLIFNSDHQPTNINKLLSNHLLKPGKNVHVLVNSKEELDCLSYWLQKATEDTFYIDKPEAIRCLSRWIDSEGRVHPGPGGALYDFLKNRACPILIINFANFGPDDIVRCNAIIDSGKRIADGIDVPADAIIIGLDVKSYEGADFTGRFSQHIEIEPFEAKYPIPFSAASPDASIDLFGAKDFKEKLLGKWTIQGPTFVWKRGFLEKNHKTIEIQNGAWEDREFRLFWQQASLKNPITLVQSTTHNWEQFSGIVNFVNKIPESAKAVIINSMLSSQLDVRYKLENDMLSTLPGFIKSAKNSTLYAYLTASITDAAWYSILKTCKKHNVQLRIVSSQDCYCPLTLPRPASVVSARSKVYVSSDVTRTVQRLEARYPDACVFEVTGCDSQILEKLDTEWTDTHARFIKHDKAVKKALLDGKHVILKGSFSQALADMLMPYILPPNSLLEPASSNGCLIVVTDSKNSFPQFLITEVAPGVLQHCEPKPFANREIPNFLHKLDKERLLLVYSAFKQAFHVVIEGETGVGKTTFIKEVLAKQPGIVVFYSVTDWASYRGTETAILFIDEANAQNRQYDCFEGLYHKKRGILDENGNFYPLGDNHYAIFAQNPPAYGGVRKEIPFFKRHPNTIQFTLLTDDYLKDKILQPYGLSQADSEFLLEIFNKAKLLSPRELEMMALFVKLLNREQAYIPIFQIVKHALPKLDRISFENWFQGHFGAITLPKAPEKIGDFVLTESRKEAYSLFTTLIDARKARVKGGLGGLVIEGAPGDGKSEFIQAMLDHHGFKQLLPHELADDHKKAFCKLPAAMALDEKKACLCKAFHAGHAVFIDEINTSSELESLLNTLLTGFDEAGKPPKHTGFMLFCTQNPISFAGRRATSLAFMRRVLSYLWPAYSQKEIQEILCARIPHLPREALDILSKKHLSIRELIHLGDEIASTITSSGNRQHEGI